MNLRYAILASLEFWITKEVLSLIMLQQDGTEHQSYS